LFNFVDCEGGLEWHALILFDFEPCYEQEVPENKRRVSTIIGTVIARRNAGIHTTFRLRRMVAGVGVESLLPL
jgi:ribosomal protein L19